ncbi:(2Fe-2S)-binding protein [Streptomyces sp. NPDC005438]|uniref:(2Fe-2S)-binding protein n=1 Tax=Streptomyces sp. NPDC005438 TaxID=3156880 RepID=UPI0033BF17F0
MPMPAPDSATLSTELSPFSTAYARLHEVFPPLRVVEGPPRQGNGWITPSELTEDGPATAAFLAHDAEQVRRDYGQEALPHVVAAFALHRYAWPVSLLVTLPWFLLRRVPHLDADALSFHRGSGQLTVAVERFSCLPRDPAAGLPGALVVDDEEELRARVRSQVADQLAPVLDSFRVRTRRGTQALWGMVTDAMTEGLWYVGGLLDEEERAIQDAGRLLPGRTTPFRRGAAFRELAAPDGRALTTRDRASCCLFYTLRPDDACVTCPRTRDGERLRRLLAATAEAG